MRGAEATAGAAARRRRAGRCVAHDGVVRPRRTRHAGSPGDPATRPADRPRAGLPAQPGGAQPTHPGQPPPSAWVIGRHDRHGALRRRADPGEHDRGARARLSPPRLRVRGDPSLQALARLRGPRRSPGLRPGRRHRSHDRVSAPRGTGGLPVVLLNCRSDAPYPAIVPDEVAGGRAAAGLVVRAGHRRGIWLVGERAGQLPARHGPPRGIVAGSSRGPAPSWTSSCRASGGPRRRTT